MQASAPHDFVQLTKDVASPLLDKYPSPDAILQWLWRMRHLRRARPIPGDLAQRFAEVCKHFDRLIQYPAWCDAPALVRVARVFERLDQLQRRATVSDAILVRHARSIDESHMSCVRGDLGLTLTNSPRGVVVQELKALLVQLEAGSRGSWFMARQCARDEIIASDESGALNLLPLSSTEMLVRGCEQAIQIRKKGGARQRMRRDIALGAILVAFREVARPGEKWIVRSNQSPERDAGQRLAHSIGGLYGFSYTDNHLEQVLEKAYGTGLLKGRSQ